MRSEKHVVRSGAAAQLNSMLYSPEKDKRRLKFGLPVREASFACAEGMVYSGMTGGATFLRGKHVRLTSFCLRPKVGSIGIMTDGAKDLRERVQAITYFALSVIPYGGLTARRPAEDIGRGGWDLLLTR